MYGAAYSLEKNPPMLCASRFQKWQIHALTSEIAEYYLPESIAVILARHPENFAEQ